MPRPLKVYGTLTMRHKSGKQHRIIVAAPTKKAAYQAMYAAGHMDSYYSWNMFSSETGNPAELKAALAQPGVVLVYSKPEYWHGDGEWEVMA